MDNDQTKSRLDGTSHFDVGTTIGRGINGCHATPTTFKALVANQIAAEWQEDTLHGCYMILQRAQS
jgi:hypothetical protein